MLTAKCDPGLRWTTTEGNFMGDSVVLSDNLYEIIDIKEIHTYIGKI